MNVGRLARTLSRLHPVQIATRGSNALVRTLVHRVPASLAPALRHNWPAPPKELRGLANAERSRGTARLARLKDEALRAYEASYGLELGGDGVGVHESWQGRVALEPYPSSIRARRLAVAIRLGRTDLDDELARAARAIMIRPELHLLGNHLLENGFGLATAGSAAVGAEADLWWSLGSTILSHQLPRQFLRDGGHEERSASYHVALTAALLETLELAHAASRPVPSVWREIAARALGWIAAVRTPDGSYPLFNDAAVDAAPAIDTVLDLGQALSISAVAPATLVDTGWIRIQSGSAVLVVDAGPDASGWQPGHTHADGLSFELWFEGQRVIADFGVSSYSAGPCRDATRATRAHNTVELAGLDSCEVWGAFRLGRRGTGRLVSQSSEEDETRLQLEHDGYAWLPGRPHHQRAIVMTPRKLSVVDRIVGDTALSAMAAVSRLRTPAPQRVRVTGSGVVRRSDGHWYREHGVGLPAVVHEQQFDVESSASWLVEWDPQDRITH